MISRDHAPGRAWYGQGVRVIDISGLADFATPPVPGVAFGDGVGMREVGSFVFPDSDTWSFKTNRIRKDGSFHGDGNDLTRGFDVYWYDGSTIGDVAPLLPLSLLTEEELAADALVSATAGTGARLHAGIFVVPLALWAWRSKRNGQRS
jgi:hypothetical protein